MKVKSILAFSVLAVFSLPILGLRNPEPKRKIDVPAERLARGEMIVMSYCALCHGAEDGKLSGKYIAYVPEFGGKFYTANITQHLESGIGKYSREQLKTLLRTRIKANGEKAFGNMPAFPLMADEDIEAIIDFLKSTNYAVQPAEVKKIQEEENAKRKEFDKKLLAYPMPSKPIPMPDPNNKMEFGKYYVNAVFRCYECHSGDKIPMDLDPNSSKNYLSGGNTMYDFDLKKVNVQNITPDKLTGIGNWTLNDMKNLLTKGYRKNGKMVRFPMVPYPDLSDTEIESIYTYLMAQKPISHQVKN